MALPFFVFRDFLSANGTKNPHEESLPVTDFVSRSSKSVGLVTQSPSLPVSQSPSHPVTQSPSHPVTQSPSHQVSQSPSLRVTKLNIIIHNHLLRARMSLTSQNVVRFQFVRFEGVIHIHFYLTFLNLCLACSTNRSFARKRHIGSSF